MVVTDSQALKAVTWIALTLLILEYQIVSWGTILSQEDTMTWVRDRYRAVLAAQMR